jgi:hypothetical protein
MRFFASWWERFPKSEAASLVAIAVVTLLGVSAHAASFVHHVVNPSGFGWA